MSKQYDEYLKGHIEGVNKAARWMVDNLGVVQELTQTQVFDFLDAVREHDMSKFDLVEYGPYDDYFYGIKNEDAFNLAWLHHIHHNPHHWQHWLLMNDDGKYRDPSKVVALEMPKTSALEMIADWWSFSWRSGNLAEVFDWYEDHKDCIILHQSTRDYVEEVLAEIKDAVDTGDEE